MISKTHPRTILRTFPERKNEFLNRGPTKPTQKWQPPPPPKGRRATKQRPEWDPVHLQSTGRSNHHNRYPPTPCPRASNALLRNRGAPPPPPPPRPSTTKGTETDGFPGWWCLDKAGDCHAHM